MTMSQQVQLVGGSTIGRDHRIVPKNNQDSWAVWQTEDLAVAIVADGCGSGRYSEIGSKLGVQLLGSYLEKEYTSIGSFSWRQVQQALLSNIDILARAISGDYRQVIEDYFLFTLVGVVIDSEFATFFAVGDGTIFVNGQQMMLGPFPGNMPPYISYNLVCEKVAVDAESIQLRPILQIPVGELKTFLIATDGIDDYIRREGDSLPGLEKVVESIQCFWDDDKYFRRNPELLSRQLKLAGRDWPQRSPEPGLLRDDTTVIVGRTMTIE